MVETMDERQQAIEACSCPREAGETLLAPKCAADHVMGAILFVKYSRITCKHLFSFGYGHFCNCANRFKLYKTYKL